MSPGPLMLDQTHGNRSAVTCHLKYNSACAEPNPSSPGEASRTQPGWHCLDASTWKSPGLARSTYRFALDTRREREAPG